MALTVEQVLAVNPYRPLPLEAIALCIQTDAPSRLVAHLILVHDAAFILMDKVAQAFPGFHFNRDEVAFGCATHDLGKTICRSELSQSGKLHQPRGVELLQSLGISPKLARFAQTHGTWRELNPPLIEDLLVALADKCWRGKRLDDLESRITELIAQSQHLEAWESFSVLDQILNGIAANADAKLAWQQSFSVD